MNRSKRSWWRRLQWQQHLKQSAPAPKAAPAAAPAPAAAAAPVPAGAETVKCPMPGKILSVAVTAGQAVKKGDLLCILEAMKMQNENLRST